MVTQNTLRTDVYAIFKSIHVRKLSENFTTEAIHAQGGGWGDPLLAQGVFTTLTNQSVNQVRDWTGLLSTFVRTKNIFVTFIYFS